MHVPRARVLMAALSFSARLRPPLPLQLAHPATVCVACVQGRAGEGVGARPPNSQTGRRASTCRPLPAPHSLTHLCSQALLMSPLFFIVRLRAALPVQLVHLALVAPSLRAECAVATASGAACSTCVCLALVAQLVRAALVYQIDFDF